MLLHYCGLILALQEYCWRDSVIYLEARVHVQRISPVHQIQSWFEIGMLLQYYLGCELWCFWCFLSKLGCSVFCVLCALVDCLNYAALDEINFESRLKVQSECARNGSINILTRILKLHIDIKIFWRPTEILEKYSTHMPFPVHGVPSIIVKRTP